MVRRPSLTRAMRDITYRPDGTALLRRRAPRDRADRAPCPTQAPQGALGSSGGGTLSGRGVTVSHRLVGISAKLDLDSCPCHQAGRGPSRAAGMAGSALRAPPGARSANAGAGGGVITGMPGARPFPAAWEASAGHLGLGSKLDRRLDGQTARLARVFVFGTLPYTAPFPPSGTDLPLNP